MLIAFVVILLLLLLLFKAYLILWGGQVGIRDKVSLCSSGYPGIHYVNQAGPELTKICLPLPPKFWD